MFAFSLAAIAILCTWYARVQDRRRMNLARISRADPLTGCLNRRGFGERFQAELNAAERSGQPVALLQIDLDRFKDINDTQGHAAGDELLIWVVRTLQEALRPTDWVGRLGGDEFAVLLPGASRGNAVEVADRVRYALTERAPVLIVLVTRPTRLAELIARFNTVAQARFYVEHLGADFSDYQKEDETYRAALQQIQTSLAMLARVQAVDRGFLPNFAFGPDDFVVTLGQDGLVANTLKYLNGQPVVGVNPDPARWDGQLLPFRVNDIPKILPEVFARRRPIKSVTMVKATLNNAQAMYGVNDLFIGPKSHVSARYIIQIGDVSEAHSSSGVIVLAATCSAS